MTLWWVEPERWHSLLAEAGFEVLECYGWFDRRPFAGGEDSVWIAPPKIVGAANCDKKVEAWS